MDFFDDSFADHYLARRRPEEIESVVAFLSDKMRLTKGSTVFDQCCGIGNISGRLAERGCRTIGVDIVQLYINRANQNAREKNLACSFIQQDARSFVTGVPCDAGFNWWTSFGYFDDDADNQKVLDCASLSLKEGGIFILDYMNSEERLACFKENAIVASKTPEGYWESTYDKTRNMLVRKWVRLLANGAAIEKKGNGAKLYTADDIARLFERSGFGDISFYGSAAGEPLTSSSPRCIAVATKTARAGIHK